MSLAAELLLAALAERMGPLAYLSTGGAGAPLLDEARVPPVRLALRPMGGMLIRDGARLYIPPISVERAPAAAARILSARPLVIDGHAAEEEALVSAAASLGGRPVIRRRRGAGDNDGALFADDDEALFMDDADDEIRALADALRLGERDEYDAYAASLRGGALARPTYLAGSARLALAPGAALDQPDERQLAAFFAEGEASFGADGACALAIPQFGGRPGSIWIDVGGTAERPRVACPRGWTAEVQRREAEWALTLRPGPGAAPRPAISVDLFLDMARGARIKAVSVEARRRRGAWEVWDEAEAQRALEESW